MDCPPSLSVLTLNALCAATEVFIPLQAHFLALARPVEAAGDDPPGLEAGQPRPQGRRDRPLPVRRRDAARRRGDRGPRPLLRRPPQRRDAPWADAKLFHTRIRRNIRLAECPSFGQSIFQYAPTSRGAEDYASLAAEIQGRAPAAIWAERTRTTRRPRLRGATPRPPPEPLALTPREHDRPFGGLPRGQAFRQVLHRVGATFLSTPIGIIDDSGAKLATVEMSLPGCVWVQNAKRYFWSGSPFEGNWLVVQEDADDRAADLDARRGDRLGRVVGQVGDGPRGRGPVGADRERDQGVGRDPGPARRRSAPASRPAPRLKANT